jgi:hypothetical protein
MNNEILDGLQWRINYALPTHDELVMTQTILSLLSLCRDVYHVHVYKLKVAKVVC